MRSEFTALIDQMPDALLQAATQQTRSGRYFEALLVALIHASPTFELIAHDLQVRQEKRTVGAFDLLIRHAENGGFTHLELAFKQYLLRQSPSDQMENWLGPRGRDRLDLKSRHMMEKQLRLGTTPEGSAAMKALGIRHARPRALMAGRLFTALNADHQVSPPPSCSTGLATGWWCSVDQISLLDVAEKNYRVLPPIYAVSPLNDQDCANLSPAHWQQICEQTRNGQPCLVAEIQDEQEVSRGWIVR